MDKLLRRVSISSEDAEVITYVPELPEGEVLEMRPLERLRWIGRNDAAESRRLAAANAANLSLPSSSSLWQRRASAHQRSLPEPINQHLGAPLA